MTNCKTSYCSEMQFLRKEVSWFGTIHTVKSQ